MRHEYELTFDELPLVTRFGGFCGAFLEGTAHLSYEWSSAGYTDWVVDAFEFEGYKVGEAGQPLIVTAESDPALFGVLKAALDASFGERIVDLLTDEMEAA
jgi:hypothetical protein